MDILIYIMALLMWAAIDFYAAKTVKEKNEGFNIEPVLYAVGAFLFGGIWPLAFLGGKYLLWKNNKNR